MTRRDILHMACCYGLLLLVAAMLVFAPAIINATEFLR